MPKFTDQFTFRNPRTARTGVLIPTWPVIIQADACKLLSEFSDEDLICIGDFVEKVIDEQAQPHNFPTDQSSWIWSRVRSGWIAGNDLESADAIRNEFGDLNLLLMQIDRCDLSSGLLPSQRVRHWHLLAVLALWKLFDAIDVTYGMKPDLIGRVIGKSDEIRRMNGAGLAMEAQAAIAHGIQLQERASHLAEAETFRDQIELFRKQVRSASGGKAKGEGNAPLKEEAKRLNADTSKRFTKLKFRYEWIADELMRKFGRTVASTTVADWIGKRIGIRKNKI
jgi:hypothetical protein